jgi:hypothetical protein
MLHAVCCILLYIVHSSERDSDSESCKIQWRIFVSVKFSVQVQSVQLIHHMLDNVQLSPPTPLPTPKYKIT